MEVIGILAVCGALLAAASLGVRALAWDQRGPAIEVKPRVAAGALLVMVVAPLTIWTARLLAIRVIGPSAPVWVWAGLPYVGSLLFAVGWLSVGGVLRPRGSVLRGVVLAGMLYVVTGLLWTVAFQVTVGGRQLAEILTNKDLILFSLHWPLQVAHMSRIFGLGD